MSESGPATKLAQLPQALFLNIKSSLRCGRRRNRRFRQGFFGSFHGADRVNRVFSSPRRDRVSQNGKALSLVSGLVTLIAAVLFLHA
jgi:hypothetical protein